MTVAVAIVAPDGAVVMATDSLETHNSTRAATIRKIVRKPVGRDGDALIATCGRTALIPLVRHDLYLPAGPDPADDDDCDAWAHRVAGAFTALAIEASPPLTVDDGSVDGHGLLAYAGRLWVICEHLAVRMHRYHAVGSGGKYAQGALHALDQAGRLDGYWLDAAREAVRAALRWDIYCGEPILVETLDSPAST